MTFDIDQAMNEKFQKGEVLLPMYGARGNLAYKDSTGAETLHAPHTPAAYNMADTLGEDRIADEWGWYENDMWDAIMDLMKVPQDDRALYDDLSARVRQIVKDLSANKKGGYTHGYDTRTAMDDALVEALNSTQNAEDKERVTKKMKDKYAPENSQYKKNRKAEADWEKAKKEKAGPMSEEQLAEKRKKESTVANNFEGTGSFKLSCDINSRMEQWDAANRAQHTEEIEKALKKEGDSDAESFERAYDARRARAAAGKMKAGIDRENEQMQIGRDIRDGIQALAGQGGSNGNNGNNGNNGGGPAPAPAPPTPPSPGKPPAPPTPGPSGGSNTSDPKEPEEPAPAKTEMKPYTIPRRVPNMGPEGKLDWLMYNMKVEDPETANDMLYMLHEGYRPEDILKEFDSAINKWVGRGQVVTPRPENLNFFW